jgi:KipI family sensor histidine kinase inhibitor
MYDEPRFLPAGDSALVLELSDAIEAECNRKIISIIRSVEKIEGIKEVVPTYRSILVYYDPLVTNFFGLKDKLNEAYKNTEIKSGGRVRTFTIPVCYGDDFGPDLKFVADHNGLSEEEVIKIHGSADYLVYMIGFMPGFTYLGGMDERIATPRLEKPREKIPAGSVGIAGKQTGIYPLDSPGGWRIIGRTPVKMYDPESENPVPIRAGDTMRFKRIGEKEYEKIKEEIRKEMRVGGPRKNES